MLEIILWLILSILIGYIIIAIPSCFMLGIRSGLCWPILPFLGIGLLGFPIFALCFRIVVTQFVWGTILGTMDLLEKGWDKIFGKGDKNASSA